jgi:ABC-type histidine transport system ATPase subunit
MSATEYLRVTDLHAFYGESHILHGMDFTRAPRRVRDRCSGATAPAAPPR